MSETCSAFVKNASLLTSSNGDIGLILVELLDLSRALRARFAGCDQRVIVALYIEHSIPATIVMLCSWFSSTNALKEAPGSAELLTQKKTLVLVVCQIVANFTACGEDARHHLVTLSFDSLGHILSSAIMTENRKAVAAFLGALYNCLLTNDTDCPSVQEAAQRRREAFVSNRGFLCQVLLSVLDTSKTNLTGANKPGDPSAPQEDPSLEWFHMLANIWVKHNLISRMFTIVGPSAALGGASFNDIVHVTHEQIILLELTNSVTEDQFFTQILFPADSCLVDADAPHSSSSSSKDFQAKLCEIGTGGLVDFLVQLAHLLGLVNTEVVFKENYAAGETTSSTTEADRIENAVNAVEIRMRRGLTLDFLPLALQVLAGTLAVLPPRTGRTLRETLATQTPLLDTLVRILRGRDVGSRARDAQLSGSGAFAHLPTQEGQGGNGEISSELLKECIRLTLQLLGNLVYGCDVAKDALRESGALAAVLSHCATDFHNPISREWALLCVRNACDNHLGNQTFIQELQPQEVVIQDEKLKEQGLRVEMNTETGQFKFVDMNKK